MAKKEFNIKYSATARCPRKRCGGLIAYHGTYSKRLPTGFGFIPGETRFSIATVTIKGNYGECMKCGAKIYARTSARNGTRYPRSINRKLVAAREAVTA